MTVVNANASTPRGRAGSSRRGNAHGPSETCADAARLTPARRKIFDILVAAGTPLGAYELIDHLAAASGKRPAPISVYRALDHLVDCGLVHRLVSRSAYLPCSHHHGQAEAAVFLICDSCGGVIESTSADLAVDLASVAAKCDFRPDFSAVELVGRCAACRAADSIKSVKEAQIDASRQS